LWLSLAVLKKAGAIDTARSRITSACSSAGSILRGKPSKLSGSARRRRRGIGHLIPSDTRRPRGVPQSSVGRRRQQFVQQIEPFSCQLTGRPTSDIRWAPHPASPRRFSTQSVGNRKFNKPHPADRSAALSITSSAPARIDCRTVRPSALAAFRLTASWNFVDCWTGRSAGFSPEDSARLDRLRRSPLPRLIGHSHASLRPSSAKSWRDARESHRRTDRGERGRPPHQKEMSALAFTVRMRSEGR
jgi:hypothetical protein